MWPRSATTTTMAEPCVRESEAPERLSTDLVGQQFTKITLEAVEGFIGVAQYILQENITKRVDVCLLLVVNVFRGDRCACLLHVSGWFFNVTARIRSEIRETTLMIPKTRMHQMVVGQHYMYC